MKPAKAPAGHRPKTAAENRGDNPQQSSFPGCYILFRACRIPWLRVPPPAIRLQPHSSRINRSGKVRKASLPPKKEKEMEATGFHILVAFRLLKSARNILKIKNNS